MDHMKPGGLLNLYKPIGMSSHDLIEIVRHLIPGKCGHTGTLDPFARGVMLVCWGKSTRLTRLFQNLPKRYRAWIRFGVETDTYDVTGKITAWDDSPVYLNTVQKQLEQYRGLIRQSVPPYSARKYQGKPLYRYARQGIPMPKSHKMVTINRLELCRFKEGRFAWAEMVVECSSGTYIRSLASDLGHTIGPGAYLASLRRENIGRFDLFNSRYVTRQKGIANSLLTTLVPPEKALYWLDAYETEEHEAHRFIHGNPIHWITMGKAESPLVKVMRNHDLLGIGRIDQASQTINPEIVLV